MRPTVDDAQREALAHIADHGACQGQDDSHWFPEGRGAVDYSHARRVCAACPVRVACLDYAVRYGEDYGMWGGSTPKERRLMRRRVA